METGYITKTLMINGPEVNSSRFFFMSSIAAVVVCFMAVFLQLKFKYHLPLQVVTSMFFLFVLGKETCSHDMASEQKRVVIETLVDWLDSFSRDVMQTMYLQTPLQWSIQDHCLQIVVVLQVFCASGVLSYMVWLFERNSRLFFISTLQEHERPAEGVDELPRLTLASQFALFIVTFAVSWKVFLDYVTPTVRIWGLDSIQEIKHIDTCDSL